LLVGDVCLARLDIEQGQGWDQSSLSRDYLNRLE
jgi:hypothetical protein